MRTSLIRNGLGFGNLGVTIRGTTKYHLSPMEQKAFAGAFSQGLPNIFWRARKSFFTVVPPFILSYLIFTETEKEHDRNGLGFGNLGVTIRGTTKYHLSPMEQKAFAGAFSQGLPNIFWRARKSFFTVVPPFILSYLIFTETEKEHDRLQRKQPGQFDHET